MKYRGEVLLLLRRVRAAFRGFDIIFDFIILASYIRSLTTASSPMPLCPGSNAEDNLNLEPSPRQD